MTVLGTTPPPAFGFGQSHSRTPHHIGGTMWWLPANMQDHYLRKVAYWEGVQLPSLQSGTTVELGPWLKDPQTLKHSRIWRVICRDGQIADIEQDEDTDLATTFAQIALVAA